jgi:hypothetical protein
MWWHLNKVCNEDKLRSKVVNLEATRRTPTRQEEPEEKAFLTNYNDDIILSTYLKGQFISDFVCCHLMPFFMSESILINNWSNRILKCMNLMIIHADYLLRKRSYKILQRPYLLKSEYLALLLFYFARIIAPDK